jgi:hypothetical protein
VRELIVSSLVTLKHFMLLVDFIVSPVLYSLTRDSKLYRGDGLKRGVKKTSSDFIYLSHVTFCFLFFSLKYLTNHMLVTIQC